MIRRLLQRFIACGFCVSLLLLNEEITLSATPLSYSWTGSIAPSPTEAEWDPLGFFQNVPWVPWLDSRLTVDATLVDSTQVSLTKQIGFATYPASVRVFLESPGILLEGKGQIEFIDFDTFGADGPNAGSIDQAFIRGSFTYRDEIVLFTSSVLLPSSTITLATDNSVPPQFATTNALDRSRSFLYRDTSDVVDYEVIYEGYGIPPVVSATLVPEPISAAIFLICLLTGAVIRRAQPESRLNK